MNCAHRCGRCCIDTKPRKFDAESANLLCNFAEMVVREIEKEKMRVRTAPSLCAGRRVSAAPLAGPPSRAAQPEALRRAAHPL